MGSNMIQSRETKPDGSILSSLICQKLLKIVKNCQNCQNCQKISKIVENCLQIIRIIEKQKNVDCLKI